MKSLVYRFEQAGESGIPFPSLGAALDHAPSHAEAQVRTSVEGLVLAEAEPVNGPGTMLRWVVTLAGADMVEACGWLSDLEADTALQFALSVDLERLAS